jgi:hypothetical protein
MSLIVSVVVVALAYPLAYYLALSGTKRKYVLLLVLIAPLAILVGAQTYPHAFPRKGVTKLFENERVTAWDVRWLRDHPGSESWPITDIAPRLGITRLIYVEVHDFRTRSARELELFRGEATASMQIIETTPGGSARVAYSEDNIHAIYPRRVPQDGLPNIGDSKTYTGEVDALSTEIVKSLITHEEDAQ